MNDIENETQAKGLTEADALADALADLEGRPRPDNPSTT